MIGSSKILTVSYGTFSCTLEGFDDSFETMKAIAEYFRDLAADDRYFGAEPPQPDAGALAQIAAQNTRGRVQALTSDTGVTLRAAPVTEPADNAPVEGASDSISAKLARIRDVVGRRDEDVPTEEPDEAQIVSPEPTVADEPIEDVADALAVKDADTAAPAADHTPIEEAIATADPVPAEANQADAVLDPGAAPEIDATPAPVDTPIEAEPQEQTAEAALDPELDADVAGLVLEAMAAEAAPETTSPEAEEPLVLTPDADAEAPAPLVLDTPTDPAPAVRKVRHRITAAPAPEPAPKPEPTFAWPKDPAFADFSQDLSALTDLPAQPPETGHNDGEAVLDDILDSLDPGTEPAEAPEPIRARVTRVRREDPIELDEAPQEATPDDEPLSAPDNLADLDGLPEPETKAPLRLENEVTPAPRRDTDIGDTDVSRLMDQADAQMNEPAGNRRRQAIAHLKAAVAATEAARRLGDPVGARGTRDQAFRDDLDTLVRPRRPRSGGAGRTERPESPVSHDIQRPVRSSGPVSPRRIGDATSSTGLPEKFADYCRVVGATTVEAQIEAALAFLIDVDNQDYVTRPWVIALVRDMDEASFDREAALRAFGSLLREQRMEDLGQRRFGLTEKTRYRVS